MLDSEPSADGLPESFDEVWITVCEELQWEKFLSDGTMVKECISDCLCCKVRLCWNENSALREAVDYH